MVLAVALSLPTWSGTASADGELGQGDEWADPAYSNSPDADWQSESDLSEMTTAVSNVWLGQQIDFNNVMNEMLRSSLLNDPQLARAELRAMAAEIAAEKQAAIARGDLAIQANQRAAEAEIARGVVTASMQPAGGGALSGSGLGTSTPKGGSPGSSTKGASPDSSAPKSSGRPPRSP